MGVIHTTRKEALVTPALPVECVSLNEIQLHYGLHFHFLLYLTFSLSEEPELTVMSWARMYTELGHVNKDHWRVQDLPDVGEGGTNCQGGVPTFYFGHFCPKTA